MSDLEEFRKLADEAAAETYDPRAGRCFPFLHQWSMWDRDGVYQFRRCIRCGKWQIGQLVSVWASCRHAWDTIQDFDLHSPDHPGYTVGRVYRQCCRHCGEVRSTTLRN